ncbi:complement C1q subcomponent subunit B-like [Liolophura sinensis]|uniref:complement C1q subcomponent subunit B-like n=1 Tax=Liolophura sinensis TaxID=3198878 RepID=UPI003158A974
MSTLLVRITLLVVCYHLPVESSYNYYNFYRHYAPSTVAFTVSKNTNQEFSETGNVEFDHVLTNVGQAFQSGKNEIKIPTTGLYFFGYFAPGEDAGKGNVDLVKNGEVMLSSMGVNGGKVAVLFVQRGDIITLQARKGSLLVSTEDSQKVAFTGYLIKRGSFDNKY